MAACHSRGGREEEAEEVKEEEKEGGGEPSPLRRRPDCGFLIVFCFEDLLDI